MYSVHNRAEIQVNICYDFDSTIVLEICVKFNYCEQCNLVVLSNSAVVRISSCSGDASSEVRSHSWGESGEEGMEGQGILGRAAPSAPLLYSSGTVCARSNVHVLFGVPACDSDPL